MNRADWLLAAPGGTLYECDKALLPAAPLTGSQGCTNRWTEGLEEPATSSFSGSRENWAFTCSRGGRRAGAA